MAEISIDSQTCRRFTFPLASWSAILASAATILLLVALHILSPEFSPSWRMISEYAFGHSAWVLSLMFLSWGISSWTLAFAIWAEVRTGAGRVGVWFLVIAGIGEALASAFDIRHPVGHGIAGLLGVLGFPIGALLISGALGRNETWSPARRGLLWIAHLSWISVVLLVATLTIMTMQMSRLNGGHLPQHAPTSLPPGVLALDGWADRLFVLCSCIWVLLAAWQAIQIRRQRPGICQRIPRILASPASVIAARNRNKRGKMPARNADVPDCARRIGTGKVER